MEIRIWFQPKILGKQFKVVKKMSRDKMKTVSFRLK